MTLLRLFMIFGSQIHFLHLGNVLQGAKMVAFYEPAHLDGSIPRPRIMVSDVEEQTEKAPWWRKGMLGFPLTRPWPCFVDVKKGRTSLLVDIH